MVATIETLSLGDARRLLAAAEAKAAQIEVPSNIAVVDAGGNLLAFARMDGAWLGSIDIAIHKAFTARAFDMPTEMLAGMAEPGKPLFGIQNTNHDRIVIFGGGAPIKVGATVPPRTRRVPLRPLGCPDRRSRRSIRSRRSRCRRS